jgi:hypothetical protein
LPEGPARSGQAKGTFRCTEVDQGRAQRLRVSGVDIGVSPKTRRFSWTLNRSAAFPWFQLQGYLDNMEKGDGVQQITLDFSAVETALLTGA